MGLLSRFRKQDEQDGLVEAYAGQCLGSMRDESSSDGEMRKELEINIHMIEDEGLRKKLDALAIYEVNIPKLDAEGKQVYDNATKEPLFIKRQGVRQWALALSVYASKVLATRYRDPYDADLAKDELRCAFLEIKLDMNVRERAFFSNFIDAVQQFCESSIDDSKNGRKALLLKVNQRRLEVGLTRSQGKKGATQ